MEYTVRYATHSDLGRIEEIYAFARNFMKEHGNPHQWGEAYPPEDMLREDIQNRCLYVVESGTEIHGVFFFYIGEDACYNYIDDGHWRSDSQYGTIHRIAGDGGGGILKTAVAFGKTQISHLRIDTHADNGVMRNAISKLGFSRRGIVYMDDNTPRIAYDLI